MNNSILKNKKLVPVLAFLCAAGWSLAYPLIKLGYSNLNVASDDLGSKIAIFNAFIPILGVIFSAIILGEPMKLKYFVTGMLVALGVYVINKFDGK